LPKEGSRETRNPGLESGLAGAVQVSFKGRSSSPVLQLVVAQKMVRKPNAPMSKSLQVILCPLVLLRPFRR
jgi:hypothetical protein